MIEMRNTGGGEFEVRDRDTVRVVDGWAVPGGGGLCQASGRWTPGEWRSVGGSGCIPVHMQSICFRSPC